MTSQVNNLSTKFEDLTRYVSPVLLSYELCRPLMDSIHVLTMRLQLSVHAPYHMTYAYRQIYPTYLKFLTHFVYSL